MPLLLNCKLQLIRIIDVRSLNMIEALSERIIDRMISYKIIDNESRIVYGYNLQLIISSILGHLFILFVFGLAGKLFELLVFLIPFDALRMFCGGYHCNTIVGCLLFSFLICEMALALQNYIYPTLLLYQGGGDFINDIYNLCWCNKSSQHAVVRW